MIFLFVLIAILCGVAIVDHIITTAMMDAVTESVIAAIQNISLEKEE
jgi:hypothetical protein